MTNQQDSTQVTMSQVYNDFKSALEGAADALKVGAEHVYEVMITQQVINSISWLIADVVLITICTILWKIFHRSAMEMKANEDDEYMFCYAIPGSISIIVLILILSSMSTVLTGLLNPEYGAIMDIKSFVQK